MNTMLTVQKEKVLRSAGDGRERLIRPFFEDFHRLQSSEEYDYPLHQHACYEVILVDQVPYACSLNGMELQVGENQMLVVKPGDWHQDHFCRGQSHYVLHFSFRGRELPARALNLFVDGIAPPEQIATSPLQEDPGFFSTLRREALQPDEYSAVIQDAVLDAFFWRLVRCFPAAVLSPAFRRRSAEQEFVNRLYRVFEVRAAENANVDALAGEMQISRRLLSMKCRDLLNDSPASLFAQFKVQKAAQLLAHTTRPIKEISYDLGFETPYHFSRVFKKYYGMPPSGLR